MPTFHIFPDFTGSEIADGRYRFLEKLGAGSFGAVYLAVDELTHGPSKPQYYAIKCIRRCAAGSHRDRLQAREIDIQQRVHRHTNIVKLHEIYNDPEFQYIVLDLCTGGDLVSAIQHGYFVGNDTLVKSIFLQILDAVEHCHRRHVSHRDLKPDNILLNAEMTKPFLADFGLAYQGLRSDEFGTGTKAYMAPECYSWVREVMKTYNPMESDIWSLGIILIGMISGSAPWSKALPCDEDFSAFLNDPHFFQNYFRVSPEAAALLDMILQTDPETRPSISRIREEVTKINTFFSNKSSFLELGVEEDLVSCTPPVTMGLLSGEYSIASEDITALRLSDYAGSPVNLNATTADINSDLKDLILYPGPFASYLDFPKPPGYRPAPIGLGIFF